MSEPRDAGPDAPLEASPSPMGPPSAASSSSSAPSEAADDATIDPRHRAPTRPTDVHPALVQLALRHPTVSQRVRARIAADDDVESLAERVGQEPTAGRVVCGCGDVLFAELERALASGTTSLAGLVEALGVGRGRCGGALCLDRVALWLAHRTGAPATELRRDVEALVAAGGEGSDRGLARISLAYARLGDDPFVDDDDEPELVVKVAGRR